MSLSFDAHGFHIYAAIVKNLRGVIYSSLDQGAVKEKVRWLARRFKYRNLGVTPRMLQAYRDVLSERLGNLLVKLAHPVERLKSLISEYWSMTTMDPAALEAYCFASVYVSPLIVLGEDSAEHFKPLVVGVVESSRDLTDKDYKLHMRIADYATTDFYLWSTQTSEQVLRKIAEKASWSDLIEERLRKVEEDKRRYWRISSEGGKLFLVYLDLLPYLIKVAGTDAIKTLHNRYPEIMLATLAVIPAVVI